MNVICSYYYYGLFIWIGLAIITFSYLLIFQPSTYGRHIKQNTFCIDNRLGWFLMELPTVILMPLFFFLGSLEYNVVTFSFVIIYIIHYFNRVFIYPFRIRTKNKKIPFSIVLSAILFNILNTFFIGYYFGSITPLYTISWFCSPFFIIGFLIFITGFYINYNSDMILINLRKKSEKGYKIPFGGFFRYVSCPNHFGEIIEWLGFAILTCSLPTLAFLIWTIANLLPRAIKHHYWYRKKFSDYPKERKIIIPYIF